MKLIRTNLAEVFLFEPSIFSDRRGWFFESCRADVLQSYGISTKFVQENLSKSKYGVLRGLHYQLRRPQAKICQVMSGAVLDVAVDIRHGSPTFGKHVMVELSANNHHQLYVPTGFAHGMLALEDDTIFVYKCDEYYQLDDSYGIAWDDTSLGIDWGIENPILSEADSGLPYLKDLAVDLLPAYAG